MEGQLYACKCRLYLADLSPMPRFREKKSGPDLNAAINIKERKYDPDITLYTPYKKVKEILEERIQKPSLVTV